jgi:dolichol kinase
MPNIILSLSSLPPPVVPLHHWTHGFSISHWVVTLIPIVISEHTLFDSTLPKPLSLRGFDAEALTLLFPLHQALIPTLDFLLATSLLPAELQLLTTALINLYLFAASPQAQILKALLWLGGMCIFISCRHLLCWEVALARIPNWKFRRPPNRSQSPRKFLNLMDHRICEKLSRACVSDEPVSDSDEPSAFQNSRRTKTIPPIRDSGLLYAEPRSATGDISMTKVLEQHIHTVQRRRHSIATFDEVVREERVRTTPSGRRKKAMEPGLASFLSLTAAQAQVRKWLYALCVYASSVLIILGPIRKYVAEYALHGQDPFGWALGYLFGNLSGFRFWVLMLNFEYWIQLPPRADADASCWLGWVEHLRQTTIGAASSRLLISGYCVVVLLSGLAVVFQLSSVAEVDTRRKLFHGMMVLMFLPTVFVDPTFCAMALALVLAVFLLLDLFRASQLPPISRPLTYFLAPYVDGRDHRGPVIVSHIFLLIGCSIPLWLSLADLPRTGSVPWAGWDVPSRDVSMVSGVICVGMGDAAASLIGRRFGRLKWFWGGGKSLEGSVAFAVAVTCGLVVVRAWLLVGRWPVSGIAHENSVLSSTSFWLATVGRAVLAAGGTSATEAILTGCNDNVVVPVVLWLLVRGLGV